MERLVGIFLIICCFMKFNVFIWLIFVCTNVMSIPCLPLVAYKGHSRQAFSSRLTPFYQRKFSGGKTLTKRAV